LADIVDVQFAHRKSLDETERLGFSSQLDWTKEPVCFSSGWTRNGFIRFA